MRSALLALGVLLCAPSAAYACGGFFCSSIPVDQAGEHILFAVEGTKVTAHVQITYQGEAENFSWVLPLPNTPTVAVGSDVLFQQLRAQTDPRFFVDWQDAGDCQSPMDCPLAMAGAGGGDPSAPPPSPAGGGGEVIAEGAVGPV